MYYKLADFPETNLMKEKHISYGISHPLTIVRRDEIDELSECGINRAFGESGNDRITS
jgi:hypothetical protein